MSKLSICPRAQLDVIDGTKTLNAGALLIWIAGAELNQRPLGYRASTRREGTRRPKKDDHSRLRRGSRSEACGGPSGLVHASCQEQERRRGIRLDAAPHAVIHIVPHPLPEAILVGEVGVRPHLGAPA